MADNLSPIWSPLIMPQYSHPDNLPDPNNAAINSDQRKDLDKILTKLRKQQLNYLSSHPEIRGIIREFFNHILNFMPPTELLPKFCRDFFNQCRFELKLKFEKRTNEIMAKRNLQRFASEYDAHKSRTSMPEFTSDWYWTSDSSSDSEDQECFD